MKPFWVNRYAEAEGKPADISVTQPEEKRGFMVRLLESIRIGAKVKKDGAEITIKGGAEF
jgi:hypothetical protein